MNKFEDDGLSQIDFFKKIQSEYNKQIKENVLKPKDIFEKYPKKKKIK